MSTLARPAPAALADCNISPFRGQRNRHHVRQYRGSDHARPSAQGTQNSLAHNAQPRNPYIWSPVVRGFWAF